MNAPKTPDQLHQVLTRQAEAAAHRTSGIELEQVLARAGEIRRGRRMRASMLMAACVLAVAGPVTVVALQADPTSAPQPASPTRVDDAPLTLAGLEQGDEPHTGYLSGRVFHNGGADVELSVDDGVVAVAPVSGGYLVSTRSETGDLEATLVGQEGDPSNDPRPMEGGFAVSPRAGVGAFVQPDGTPVAIQANGDSWIELQLPKVLGGSGFDAVAVEGEDCRDDCTVWVDSKGEEMLAWRVDREGIAEAPKPVRLVSDVSGDAVAGTTSISDDGSCSAVTSTKSAKPRWDTCDHRLLAFSRDGEHLLASGAYASGMGDTELAVLDADNGEVLLELSTVEQATITQMTWEDDSHLLATVFEAGRWAVLRIGLDGTRELAVTPVTGVDDVTSPFVLPTF